MRKKDYITLTLATTLLMTAQAVPVLAADSTPGIWPQQTTLAQGITPRWEKHQRCCPGYLDFRKADFCIRIHFTQKNDDLICGDPLFRKEGWKGMGTCYLMAD